MCVTYAALSCKLATSFSTFFQFSSSQIKMANYYKVHVIFQDMEHQIKENILHQFFHYSFFEILIKLRSIFDPLKIIYWKLLRPYKLFTSQSRRYDDSLLLL